VRKVAILAGKGGVGKSTITIGLAEALRDKGYKVGILDCDFTMPNDLIFLNSPNLKPKLVKNCIVIPPEVNGIKVISWGMIWKEGSAVQVEDIQIDGDDLRTAVNLIKTEKYSAAIKYLEQLIENPGGAIYYLHQLFDEELIDWGNTDFLVCDTAPTTSGTIRAVAEVNLDGSIVVTQPSKPSFADVARTIDMLRKKEVPIYGVIVNMVGGRFELKEKDVIEFCQKQKLPLIHSIPFLKPNDPEFKNHFSVIADYVLSHKPVILEQEKVSEEWKKTVSELERFGNILDIFRK